MKRTARDIMRRPVFRLTRGTILRDAARQLTDRNISGAPVIGDDGGLLGVVSLFDMVAQMAGLEAPEEGRGGFYSYQYPGEDAEDWESDVRRAEENPFDETTIDEIMTPKIVSVAPGLPVEKVARRMVAERIHRVLVMEDGELLGVISTMDLLRAMSAAPRKARRA